MDAIEYTPHADDDRPHAERVGKGRGPRRAKVKIQTVVDGKEIELWTKDQAQRLLQAIAAAYAPRQPMASIMATNLIGKWNAWEAPKELKVTTVEKAGLSEETIDAIIADETA
jgi:hypothetical protein